MKKLLIAAMVALSLGGCATVDQLVNAAQVVTKSYANPVTKDELYKVESGVSIAFTALNAYKDSCARGLVDTNCKANVAAVQTYTRQLPPLLVQLRGFVKNNDQINAITVYNQIVALVTNFKTAAANVGINVGG
jgi:uncharacterized protein YceK